MPNVHNFATQISQHNRTAQIRFVKFA